MRRGVRAVSVPAVCVGLLVAGCGGSHRDEPLAGGYAQPSSGAPEPSASAEPASPTPSRPSGPPVPTEAPESPPVATEGPGAASPTAGPLEIRTRETKYGRILIDGPGRTIYVADRDNADFESTCSGPCTREWPPLFTNGQVTAGPGVNSAWLGTIGRTDGPTQVEYNGWPLYYSTRDTRPGDLKGQGVSAYGTTWHVIDADKGQKVK
jgi:predicted lipoprotein with Yx(FWY)xxD motif